MTRFAASRLSVLTLLTSIALAGAACQDPKPAGMAEAKKVKDDGKVREMPKPEPAPISFEDAFVMNSAFDAATGTVNVTLDIKDGFHAYAPGEEVGIPVAMVVNPTGGWTMEGAPVIPEGKDKDLGELGKSKVLVGKVPLKAKVKGGKGTVSGAVKVQICTSKACDRPRTHAFEVK